MKQFYHNGALYKIVYGVLQLGEGHYLYATEITTTSKLVCRAEFVNVFQKKRAATVIVSSGLHVVFPGKRTYAIIQLSAPEVSKPDKGT